MRLEGLGRACRVFVELSVWGLRFGLWGEGFLGKHQVLGFRLQGVVRSPQTGISTTSSPKP